MTGRFSGGWGGLSACNFTKLDVNVVKHNVVLEFRTFAPFLHKRRRQTGRF